MDTLSTKQISQATVLNGLLHQHMKFQEFLDTAAVDHAEQEVVDVLIQVRQFNVDCISKYTDLISNEEVHIKPAKRSLVNSMSEELKDSLIMNKINNQLSMLLPYYRRALSNKAINGFGRMIIGNNAEKIIHIKDNLLHPLPELFYA
ncbi:MAG: hypothetical protein HKN09_05905 [Saprospiraceae bacterium]|nr:hypothetical protein [Saprospiraceae bacterium]